LQQRQVFKLKAKGAPLQAIALEALDRPLLDSLRPRTPQPPRGRWVDAATSSRKGVRKPMGALLADRWGHSVDVWWTLRIESIVRIGNGSGR
jgi:hypothetical protein